MKLAGALGRADAYVVSGARGAAILLGADFFGINLSDLGQDEWEEHKRQRGAILLHELLHVYDIKFTDRHILTTCAQHIFVGGLLPTWGGSRWISIWIGNDCKPIDLSQPNVFW